MRQWTHQHNVPTRRHKVVMPSLFMLCEGSKPNPGDLLLCEGRKSNPGDLLLCEGSKSNPGDLLLCEGSKSNPETFYYVRATNLILETFYYVMAANLILDILCWLVHQPPLSILFSTNNRYVPYPVCTAFSHYFPFQPRDWLGIRSLLLSPYYFLFESSPRFMLQLSPFLCCLNKALDSNAWSSFTSNNTKNLGGFGRADGSRKRCTCRHVGSWGSRARPLSKNLYLRVTGMSAVAGRICRQYGREEEGSEDLPSRRCVGEKGTGRGSGPFGSCGFPPSPPMTAWTMH